MFEHSVKVPRHYKIAANIFKKVSTEGGSVKTLLYDNKLRHFRTNVLFALITETIKHAADIDKIFENCNIIEKESRIDPWLAKVLAAELLFGKKALPGKSKPEQTILSYKEKFAKYVSEHQDDMKIEAVRRPRYVRINTNLLTTSDAIGSFQDEGYRFVRCTSGTYDDYLQQIQNLTEYDFTQDYHVKTVFVFSSGTKLHEHELYLENKIILQDKATTLAVHLLAAPPGSAALDMCAAPGMKTTQLAAFMRNSGKIYAVERNEKRYQTLCDFVTKTGSTCVETLHKDALEIKRGDFDDVEYILLDPSCSGSGMELCVHNYIEATRLAKLTSLQEKFLKHAMNSFPKAKRIVYSTCSLFPEENERVITNVVKTSRAKWRVQDIKELLKGQWNNFGSGMYGSMGTRCLYAKPESDFTTGFFMAVLDRDQKDLEKATVDGDKVDDTEELIEEVGKANKRKFEKEADEVTDEIVEEIPKLKKKKKDKHDRASRDTVNNDCNELNENGATLMDMPHNNDSNIVDNNLEYDSENKSKKKKKKDKQKTEVDHAQIENINIDTTPDNINEKKAKKKRKKDKDTLGDGNTEELQIADSEIPVKDDLNDKAHKKKKKKKKSTESREHC